MSFLGFSIFLPGVILGGAFFLWFEAPFIGSWLKARLMAIQEIWFTQKDSKGLVE